MTPDLAAEPSSFGDLPIFNDEFAVAAARVDDVRTKGHTLLRGVASEDEVAAWQPVLRDIALAHTDMDRTLLQEDTFGKAFWQISNLWQLDSRAAGFSLGRRFGQIAADLLGVDAVRIYHDQAVLKKGGDGHTPLHQDQHYFPLDGDEIITMWMPLVPVPAEVGSLRFASGSQVVGTLGEIRVTSESDAELEALMDHKGFPFESYGAMAPGDATFHTGWVLHGAAANPTHRMREVMTVIFFADGLRGIEPEHEWHQRDYDTWLPGVKPGDVAASALNPVVWSRNG